MKFFNKASLAAAVLVATLGAGNASAFTLPTLPELSSNNVNVIINNGVATLHGTADNNSERAQAEHYVQNLDNVDKVINLISVR